MKCKICGTENKKVSYHLRNASVIKCKNCNFHQSTYLDEEFQESNVDLDKIVVPNELKTYLKTQLQNNDERLANQLNTVKKYLPNLSNAKILDVGSGGGLFLSKMKEAGADCYGIELDLERLKFSEEEYNLNNIHAHPVQADFWMDNHAGSFDLVTLWDVIEHVNSPGEIISSARKLLKKGGFLIMDTPCRDTFYHQFGEITYTVSMGKFPTFLNIMYSDHPYGHKQILAKKDIRTLYNNDNFKVDELEVFHELSFPNRYYLTVFFKNETIVNILNPIVNFLFKFLRIRNKMLVVGHLNG